MADPRNNIVKPCPPAYLGASSAGIGASTTSRNAFFKGAGKVGDLEVLNSVGAGKVGQGLRTLSSVSSSIRQGCGSLPTALGGALGAAADATGSALTAGSDWVLGQMGMGTNTVDAVRAFHPEIANQALGQATAVYDRVRQGKFKTSDIPSYLQDFQNLERLGRNIFTPGGGDRQSKLEPQCEASPYAIDLIERAPKHKFMFIVQFVPNGDYTSLADLDWAFTVQESTRPGIQYQTEDVNFYNFRSKIITKTTFDPMSMKFYDDIRDQTGQFYAAYMKATAPVTNYAPGTFIDPENEGMDFATEAFDTPTGTFITPKMFSASSSSLNGSNTKTVFKEIILYHLFDAGRKMDVYHFYNPRVTEMKPDGLNMKESAATELELNFVYDSVFVDTMVSFDPKGGNSSATSAHGAANPHNSSIYPLRYISTSGGLNKPNDAAAPQSMYVGNTSSTCGTDINTK